MKKSKWVVYKFLPYEYKELEEYLETMALKGWKLESIYGYYIKFKKIEPQVIKYSVDVMDSISFFDGKNSNNVLEYREYCRGAGWEFVCEKEKIQVYCSSNYIETIPIHTDEKENFENIFNASLKYMLFNLLTILIMLYSQYINVFKINSGNFLANKLSLMTLFSVSILALNELMDVINFTLWLLKISRILNSKLIKFNTYIYKFGIYSIIVMIVFVIISGQYIVAKMLLINLLLAYVLYKLKNFTESSGFRRKRSINIIAYVIISIVTIAILNAVLFKDILTERNYSNDSYAITLEDFNDKPNSSNDYLYIDKEESIFAKRLFYSINGECINLNYELFESEYEWIINYKFKCIKEELNEFGVNLIKLDTSLPEEVKVYKNEKNNYFYIVLENKILELGNIENYNNEDELLKTVYKKLI